MGDENNDVFSQSNELDVNALHIDDANVLANQTQLIVFAIDEEEYGLEIGKIQEVIRIRTIKKLPRTPNYILGVMNLRGNIIPIVGLREKFGFEPIEFTQFTRIIVVNHRDKMVGMLVDSVHEVVNVSLESVESSPEIVDDKTKALIRGVARAGERIILLVELDYLIYDLAEIIKEE